MVKSYVESEGKTFDRSALKSVYTELSPCDQCVPQLPSKLPPGAEVAHSWEWPEENPDRIKFLIDFFSHKKFDTTP
jgi:hypothetical protein